MRYKVAACDNALREKKMIDLIKIVVISDPMYFDPYFLVVPTRKWYTEKENI